MYTQKELVEMQLKGILTYNEFRKLILESNQTNDTNNKFINKWKENVFNKENN